MSYQHTTSREVINGKDYITDVEIREYDEESEGHAEIVIRFYRY